MKWWAQIKWGFWHAVTMPTGEYLCVTANRDQGPYLGFDDAGSAIDWCKRAKWGHPWWIVKVVAIVEPGQPGEPTVRRPEPIRRFALWHGVKAVGSQDEG